MRIELVKIDKVLTSRQTGREAYAALQPDLIDLDKKETIEIDFAGISTLTPSWADEFITPLKAKYGDRVILLESNNSSVTATLDILK